MNKNDEATQNIENTQKIDNSKGNGWSCILYLSTFLGSLFPFANILAPLAIWLVKKSDHKNIDQHGKEVINFQMSISLYITVLMIFIFAMSLGAVAAIILFLLAIFSIIVMIVGAIKAYNGKKFKAPLKIRFIK